MNEMRFISSIRKENIPVPEYFADVNISPITEKQQYFSFNDSNTDIIDYNDIIFHVQFLNEPLYYWFHRLQINNGIVELYLDSYRKGEEKLVSRGDLFYGFLEITEESNDIIKGKIRFTNGIPYCYVKDGTADIEIRSEGSIRITMFYKPEFRQIKWLETSFKINFPAKLILEF